MKKKLTLITLLTLSPIFAADKTIVRGTDHFELIYEMALPKLPANGTLWVPLAGGDAFQKFQTRDITSPVPWRKTRDVTGENEILVLHPTPADSGKRITIRYQVTRKEKAAHAEAGNAALHLKAEKLVPLDPRFTAIAKRITANAPGNRARGKALYDHVLAHMRYDKTGKGWGRGDALYACNARTGNCTDYHAYFIALCRAANIPARFAIGFTIPADRNAGAISGYHCWAEFFANGKWTPVDISEADKQPKLAGYYFGHHPANRLELSRGRDITVMPAPKAGSFNYFFGPHLEVDGKTVPVKANFKFKRLTLKD
ncbi:MAG: transglutaminase domain-containing protein [Verrucomicrobia subdivision 3 bacterium]|nr:transglutaminase domain-containing protein [Limisphaerales bacterium]